MASGLGILIIILGSYVGYVLLCIILKCCCSKSVSKTEPVPVQSKPIMIDSNFTKNTKLRGSAFDNRPGVDDLTGARIHPLPLPIPEPIETHSLPQHYGHVVV